jgi:hypothetical protein
MIGLSWVTPRSWLLPPARGLAPTSVVVVVPGLKFRATASRSAVSLAPILTHALLPDGGSWILLIQLDPGPLHVKECLAHVRIVDALEDGRDPGKLIVAEPCKESRKTITAISPFRLDFFTYLTPGGDHSPRIAAFIDVLAQVFCRRPMIGLLSHPIYKNINRAIIYAPGSSHAYIQQIIKISQHMSRIKAYKL